MKERRKYVRRNSPAEMGSDAAFRVLTMALKDEGEDHWPRLQFS